MNIWITKNSEVPVRDQLTLQVILGIAGGDLQVGERLPSTAEISRRFGIHSNTVSAAYQKLVDEKMLEFRKGSGYYVRDAAIEIADREAKAAALITALFEDLRRLGFDDRAITERVGRTHPGYGRKRITLFEPDAGLRNILEFELRDAGFDVTPLLTETFAETVLEMELLVAMFDERARIEAEHVVGRKCVYLRGRSVAASLSAHSRPSAHDTIGVVSAWDGFLSMAKVMLLAANIEPGNLVVRSTQTDGWESAVASASILICDALTASRLPQSSSLRVFRLIADASFDEVKSALKIM
ncbi:MAG: GntR family transcriptional regulator [Acidobacteriota bacterium]